MGNILWITNFKEVKGDKYNLNFIMSNCANGLLMVQPSLTWAFFQPSVMGGGGGGGMMVPHHNFVVIAPMIMKFGTDIKLDVFYTMVTKNCDVTIIT